MSVSAPGGCSDVPITPLRQQGGPQNEHLPTPATDHLSRSMSRKKPPSPMPQDTVLSVPFSPAGSEASGGSKQPFWKFHMIRFGRCMYLSTNPTSRHLHCRNAPGYFVRDEGKGLRYRLVFEDTETAEPLVVVQRDMDQRNSELEYVVYQRQSAGHRRGSEQAGSAESTSGQDGGDAESAREAGDPARSARGLQNQEDSLEVLFRGRLRRTPIPPKLLPVAPMVPMVNYDTRLGNDTWSVGSIPRTRESRVHGGDKYVGKQNVYFHQSFQDLSWFAHRTMPPVTAVYRECEARSKKRLLRSLNRLSRTSMDKMSPYEVDANPYEAVQFYYKAGDGLYDVAPADDEPDTMHKMGWVTVFEDVFVEQPGVLDLVVALTVAVQHERRVAYGA